MEEQKKKIARYFGYVILTQTIAAPHHHVIYFGPSMFSDMKQLDQIV